MTITKKSTSGVCLAEVEQEDVLAPVVLGDPGGQLRVFPGRLGPLRLRAVLAPWRDVILRYAGPSKTFRQSVRLRGAGLGFG